VAAAGPPGPLKSEFQPSGPIVAIFQDPNGLNATCSRGIGDKEAPCAPTLAAGDAENITIALPPAYLHGVAPKDRDEGIIFSIFVGGAEQTLATRLVLPPFAFGG
jgi:hypothetical protein